MLGESFKLCIVFHQLGKGDNALAYPEPQQLKAVSTTETTLAQPCAAGWGRCFHPSEQDTGCTGFIT